MKCSTCGREMVLVDYCTYACYWCIEIPENLTVTYNGVKIGTASVDRSGEKIIFKITTD